jgi:hypothetical protein
MCTAVAEKGSVGLLIGVRPLDLAESVCRSIVGGVRIVDGAHLLEADPTWTGAINTEARWRTRVPLTLKDTILLSEILNPEYVSKALR